MTWLESTKEATRKVGVGSIHGNGLDFGGGHEEVNCTNLEVEPTSCAFGASLEVPFRIVKTHFLQKEKSEEKLVKLNKHLKMCVLRIKFPSNSPPYYDPNFKLGGYLRQTYTLVHSTLRR